MTANSNEAPTFGYIDHTVTEDTITVFWDQPEPRPADPVYIVMLDDVRIASTRHTHWMFDHLEADHPYQVRIELDDGDRGNSDGGSDSIPGIKGRRTADGATQPADHATSHATNHATGHTASHTAADIADTGIRPQSAASFAVETRTLPRKSVIDVTKPPYNAVGDGTTLNTAAIQHAIDDCGPDQAVLVPAGTFLTGALFLHDDMELRVAEGATLQGSADPKDYEPLIRSRFEGIERDCYASLLNIGTLDHTAGPNCHNIILRGGGTIYGGGSALAKAQTRAGRERLADYIERMKDRADEFERGTETIASRMRGRLVNVSNGENILMENLTLGYAAAWNIHFIYSKRIVTHRCHIDSMGVWNGDGWDPDSSEDCAIFDCDFTTGDDMVAIKSGKNPEGNVINRPTRNIRVFDCRADGGHGIAIGSEMSGGVEHVRIWDCDMGKSKQGLEIKASVKRGGYVRDVTLSNCIASRVLVHNEDSYNQDGEAAPTVPYYENIHFEHIRILGRHFRRTHWEPCPPIEINGFDDEGRTLRNITFDQVSVDGTYAPSSTAQ